MAKFNQLNIELLEDQKVKLGTSQDVEVYYHGNQIRIEGDIVLSGALSGGTGTSRCSVYMSGDQNVPTYVDTYTKAAFDTIDFDELDEWNTTDHKFEAKNEGYYLVSATGCINSMPDGAYISVYIRKNTGGAAYCHTEVGGTVTPRYNVTKILYCRTGDDIKLWVRQNSGGTLTLDSAKRNTFMTIHRLS